MSRCHAVVLAAGGGSRFGGSKLTAPWQGGVLLEAALRSAGAAPVESVVVVTGPHGDLVEAAVHDLASTLPTPMRTIRCADHASGMSASLRCGLSALPPDACAAFVFLGDMPRVPPGLADRLLDAVEAGALAAAPARGERLGHPVLIARALFEAFATGAGDGGGQRILRGLGDGLAKIQTLHDGAFLDIDTPADLDRARERSFTN